MRNDGISVKIIIATAVCIAVLLFTSFFPVSLPQPSSHSTAVSLPCTATASPTHSFSITLNGTPKGNGTYQQLFTIGNSTYPFSNYGINSQGSNFLISYSNGSNAYTWIQSINSTAITFWTSLYYSTDLVDLNVFPAFENLFSSEGFLGIADTSTDNGILVFNTPSSYYADVYGTSSPNIYYSPSPPVNITQDNGLRFHNTSSLYNVYLNREFNGSVTTYFYVSGFSGSLDVALVYTNTSSGSQTLLTTTKTGLYSLSNNTYISTVRFVENNNAIGYENITYWFVVPEITMPTYTITPQLNFTHTVYTYTVYIATVTNENPAYTASGLTNLTFKATGYSWAYFPSSDKLEVNPPPYLLFSNSTGNYGVYNITMQMTATSNITHKTITATAYAEVTVIGYVRLNVTKITQSANSLFPTLTEREIMFLITAVVSIVVALILMSFVAERKVKRKEEEKYEKEWLKHD